MGKAGAPARAACFALTLTTLTTLTAAMTHARVAHADPTDKAAAQAMFTEAMDLRTRGELSAALVKFKLAHRLGNTPVTGLELGRTLASLGKLVDAQQVLDGVASIEKSPRESRVTANARSEAAKLALQVHVRTPTLAVRLAGTAAATARVELDGQPLEAAQLGALQQVDPGPHHLIAKDEATLASADVQLGEGESRTITLTVDAPRATAPVEGAPASGPPTPIGPSRTPPRTPPVIYAGFGLTGAGVLVGGIFGVLAFDKTSTLSNECNQHICTRAQQSDIDSARARGLVSTVAFVAAGVTLAVTLTALVWTSSNRESAKTTAVLR